MKRALSLLAAVMALMLVLGVGMIVFQPGTRPGNVNYSGIETDVPIRAGGWIDAVFDACVRLLLWLADLLSMTYTEINIVVFCMLWPIFTLTLIVVCVVLFSQNRRLKKQLAEVKI